MPCALYVTGATSVLGWALTRVARARDSGPVTPCCSPHAGPGAEPEWPRINAEDPDAWRRLFAENEIETLIHAGGVCDVGRCEADPTFAWAVNVDGVRAMLDALPGSVRLVYCSSDHVFGGRPGPYPEDAAPEPISAYGRTRVAAEQLVVAHDPRHLVVRTGLPLGPSPGGRTGHLDWLRRRHARGLPMTLIEDEHRSAVWADDAARRILDLTVRGDGGIRHMAAPAISRPALARRLAAWLGIDPCFELRSRAELKVPHLGRVELASLHEVALALTAPTAPARGRLVSSSPVA